MARDRHINVASATWLSKATVGVAFGVWMRLNRVAPFQGSDLKYNPDTLGVAQGCGVGAPLARRNWGLTNGKNMKSLARIVSEKGLTKW